MESDSIETRSYGCDKEIDPNLRGLQHAEQVQHPMSVLPDVRAKPDKVREFISHLLKKRGVPEGNVRKIVRQWTLGSGREMRSYDPAMYLDIFGCEDGWIIYREVRLRIHEELCENFTYKYEFEIGAVVLLTFTAGMSYIFFCDVGPRDLLWLIAVFGVVSGGTSLLIWMAFGLLLTGSPEEEIEKKLRQCKKLGNAKRD